MKFDVIRIVYEQETVELRDIGPGFAVSPLQYFQQLHEEFNKKQVSYSQRDDWMKSSNQRKGRLK